MSSGVNKTATVYTETVVHVPAAQFAADAPYQLAIVTLESGARQTVRILGDRVNVGDAVDFVDSRNGIDFFRRAK